MLPVMMHPDEQDTLIGALPLLSMNATIVEFGSGGSTCMFADHLGAVQYLISIEHNAEWYNKVTDALKTSRNLPRIQYHYIPPAYPLEFYAFAHPYEECPAGLENYIKGPDIDWTKVEMVLVDGVARGAVLATLATKLRPNTRIFLHDYTDRETWYDWAVNLYKREERVEKLLELRSK